MPVPERNIENLTDAIQAMAIAKDHSDLVYQTLASVEEWLEIVVAQLGFAGINAGDMLLAVNAVNKVRRVQAEMSQAIEQTGDIVRRLT